MRYCTKCGRELIKKQGEAQNELNSFYRRFDKYDSIVGEQQFVEWKECPKYHWWNGHDRYIAKLIT